MVGLGDGSRGMAFSVQLGWVSSGFVKRFLYQSLSCPRDKIPAIYNLSEGRFILLIVSKGSVHGQFVLRNK